MYRENNIVSHIFFNVIAHEIYINIRNIFFFYVITHENNIKLAESLCITSKQNKFYFINFVETVVTCSNY
jgi:hypothetical protein